MNYIIDANNLAGKLNLLEEKDFDKELINIVKEWLGDKQKIVVLVFDSLDPLGDRLSLGNLEVIYSPRDNYSQSADDKILEIFRQWAEASCQTGEDCKYNLNIIKKISKNNLAFVSDDFDLRNRVANIKEDISEKISLMYNDEFIQVMNGASDIEEEDGDSRGLDSNEVQEINDELLDIWK